MNEQRHYVGLDVSLETTSISVIDDAGAIIWRGKCSSDPDAITATLRQHAPGAVWVGLETGQLSNWLTLGLRRRAVPVVCMEQSIPSASAWHRFVVDSALEQAGFELPVPLRRGAFPNSLSSTSPARKTMSTARRQSRAATLTSGRTVPARGLRHQRASFGRATQYRLVP